MNNSNPKPPARNDKISINLKRLNAVNTKSDDYVKKVADLLIDSQYRHTFDNIDLVDYIGTLYKSNSFKNDQNYRDRTKSMVKKEVNVKLENIFQQPTRGISKVEQKPKSKSTKPKVSKDIFSPIKHYQSKLLKYCKDHMDKLDNSPCPNINCKQYIENMKTMLPNKVPSTEQMFSRITNKMSFGNTSKQSKSEMSSHLTFKPNKKNQNTPKLDIFYSSSHQSAQQPEQKPQQIHLNKSFQIITLNNDVISPQADKVVPIDTDLNAHLPVVHPVSCGINIKQNNLSIVTTEPNEQRANLTIDSLCELSELQMRNARKARLSKDNIQEMIRRSSIRKSIERPFENSGHRRSTNSESGDKYSSDYEYYYDQTEHCLPKMKGFTESVNNYLSLAGSYNVIKRTNDELNRSWSGTLLNDCRLTNKSARNYFGNHGYIDGIDDLDHNSKKAIDILKDNDAFNALSHMFTLKRLLEGKRRHNTSTDQSTSLDEKAKSQLRIPSFLLTLLNHKKQTTSSIEETTEIDDNESFDTNLVTRFQDK